MSLKDAFNIIRNERHAKQIQVIPFRADGDAGTYGLKHDREPTDDETAHIAKMEKDSDWQTLAHCIDYLLFIVFFIFALTISCIFMTNSK